MLEELNQVQTLVEEKMIKEQIQKSVNIMIQDESLSSTLPDSQLQGLITNINSQIEKEISSIDNLLSENLLNQGLPNVQK